MLPASMAITSSGCLYSIFKIMNIIFVNIVDAVLLFDRAAAKIDGDAAIQLVLSNRRDNDED